MWNGIAVLGTSTLSQASSAGIIIPNQGFVSINTATISNARCAITTGTHYPNGNFNFGTTGGVIWAHQADFINNSRDVQYMWYVSPSGPHIANAGFFNNCRFLTNSTLSDGSEPMGRVSMYNVNGVKFRGCEFAYNAGNAYTPTKHGYGIFRGRCVL